MKVVTWNIDLKTDKSKLWDYLDQEINPDILLLQECRNFPSRYQGIGEHIGGSRSWGSVVLSKKYTLEPMYLPNHVGWVAGARTEINDIVTIGRALRPFPRSKPCLRLSPHTAFRTRSCDRLSTP
jgi:hypothetical protein